MPKQKKEAKSVSVFSKKPWIRLIYLYLFSLVGLILMVIGSAQLVELGLKVFIFTEADRSIWIHEKSVPMPANYFMRGKELQENSDPSLLIGLTDADYRALQSWKQDYENWKMLQSDYDPQKSDRQRTAANALALFIVGIPLFFYHWRVIQGEKQVV